MFAGESRIRRKLSWSAPLFLMEGGKVLVHQVGSHSVFLRKYLSWETLICNLTAVPLESNLYSRLEEEINRLGWESGTLPSNELHGESRGPLACTFAALGASASTFASSAYAFLSVFALAYALATGAPGVDG